MDNSNRRGFIKTLTYGVIGTSLATTIPHELFALDENSCNGIEIQKGYCVFDERTQKSMEALADALVPGAKDIDIKSIFLNFMNENHGLAGYYDAGFWNLDTISRSKFKNPFYKITKLEEKKEILAHIAGHNPEFLKNFKDSIVSFYYTNPKVFKKLAYNGPPQPLGFMDYAQKP